MNERDWRIIERAFYTLQRLERAGLLLPTEKENLKSFAKIVADRTPAPPTGDES